MHLFHQMYGSEVAILCDFTGANMAPFSLFSDLGNLKGALRMENRFSGGTYRTVQGMLQAMERRPPKDEPLRVTTLFVVLPNERMVALPNQTDETVAMSEFLQVPIAPGCLLASRRQLH